MRNADIVTGPNAASISMTIPIVDENPGNLGALGDLLRSQYRLLAAPSDKRAERIVADTDKPGLLLPALLPVVADQFQSDGAFYV